MLGTIAAMLAFERSGTGRPLILLHGTNCSRRVWEPILPSLTPHRDVIAVDLPAHGASPPTSPTPPAFARELVNLLDALELGSPPVVGHSVGGWTALELAKLGRAGAVLALAPAGLWRRRSPWLTDVGLRLNWRVGQLLGTRVSIPLQTRLGRRLGLATISARPADVPRSVAVALAEDAVASAHFPEHFAATRVLRFTGGTEIPSGTPVRVVWGDRDRVALRRHSRSTDQLPPHTTVETWTCCGHMVMWDRREDTVAAALKT